MWTYKDQTTFAPILRKQRGPDSEYHRGWCAALVTLKEAVSPDVPLRHALIAVLEKLFAAPRELEPNHA